MSELAEGARLEIVCAAKSGTEGSNPSLSAILIRGYGFKGRKVQRSGFKGSVFGLWLFASGRCSVISRQSSVASDQPAASLTESKPAASSQQPEA
jgi:hypothetical protein